MQELRLPTGWSRPPVCCDSRTRSALGPARRSPQVRCFQRPTVDRPLTVRAARRLHRAHLMKNLRILALGGLVALCTSNALAQSQDMKAMAQQFGEGAKANAQALR